MTTQQSETFETRMASLLPGTIVFCGHRKSNISILMRRLVEHFMDRPQTAEASEELSVQIYVEAPDPLWTGIMDGRDGDKRVRIIVGGADSDPQDMLPQLQMRINSETRPADHMIVVLDHARVDGPSFPAWQHLMRHAYDYNVSFLLRSYTPPSLHHPGGFVSESQSTDLSAALCRLRIEDHCLAAVLAWDACATTREGAWHVFGASFGSREEFEKHYHKLTIAQAAEVVGGNAMIIEYRGVSNFAYTCAIPNRILLKQ